MKANPDKAAAATEGSPQPTTAATAAAAAAAAEPEPAADHAIFTVINSDGTTSYYTSNGDLIDGEISRPTEATKEVTDSDRVTAKGTLNLRSKKTERMKRKLEKKNAKSSARRVTQLLDLPNETLTDIISHMLPSEVYKTAQTCKTLHELIQHNEKLLSRRIISQRYPILAKCFRLPVILDEIDPELHPVLQNSARIEMLGVHRRYVHVPQPEPYILCTCLTCVLRWQACCVIVDFDKWRPNLDSGVPITNMRRGQDAGWNMVWKDRITDIVLQAVRSPLAHAHMLEIHLNNTCAAVKRQSENKGNKRRHFKMSRADVESQTDAFLEGYGQPTIDLPYSRDNYYMLEAYMPGRTWLKDDEKWVYIPPDFHDRDLDWVAKRWGPEWGIPSGEWGTFSAKFAKGPA
ncbi:F-box domain-containing protein [Colletotrichum orchidophilum]|uniref:F-box domain-containing protein n=1 Tax=Colletotrichum orchidophilum TaxID=1209926 RepID=A0A1G4BHQ9_9PEZI|nr:F-box domain-containing protein [Colletotrichum orchidophilum]OHF00838.1 F-box domain-containing protein [Colletotrichum orchidophilum]